jgi:SAM-dependent methyltransferase
MSEGVNCRSCGHKGLATVLSLGRTPLANALLSGDQLHRPEPTYPLDLAFCPGCSLVQIEQTVPPEQLFREYVYFSSFSSTMLRHAQDLAGELVEGRRLGPASLVVEAASNDGYLLQYYQERQVPVLGIEPAVNVARVARDVRGVPTVSEFFGRDLAARLRAEGRRADVFHAHNVLAHVPDLNGFVEGIGVLLKDDGVAVIEVPYVKEMLENCEFDTIYHEHIFYFSLTALDRLFRRHGLVIHDARRVAIHGGTLRLYASPQGAGVPVSDNVTALLQEEAGWGVDRLSSYQGFAGRVQALKASLCDLLKRLKGQGKRLAAYGASAKGSTLLNYFGIGAETLDFVIDRSTVKQGRYTPGTRLPICPPERLLEARPDYVLLLTWNFAEEIFDQQIEYLKAGGRFVIPVPEVRVVEYEFSDDVDSGSVPDRATAPGGRTGVLRPHVVPS